MIHNTFDNVLTNSLILDPVTSHFRSLGKTLVVKVCVKKTVSQLEKDKRTPAQAIQDDLNDQVSYSKRNKTVKPKKKNFLNIEFMRHY